MNFTVDDQGRAVVSLPLRVWVALAATVEQKSLSYPPPTSQPRPTNNEAASARKAYISRALSISNFISDRLTELQEHVTQSNDSETKIGSNGGGRDHCVSFRSRDITADNFVVKTVVDIPRRPEDASLKPKAAAVAASARSPPPAVASVAVKQSPSPSIPSVDIDDIGMGFFSSVNDDELQALYERSRKREEAKEEVLRTNEPCFGFFSRMSENGDGDIDGPSPAPVAAEEQDCVASADDRSGIASSASSVGTGGNVNVSGNGNDNSLDILKDVEPQAFLRGVVGVDVFGSLRDNVVTFSNSIELAQERYAQLHQVGELLYFLFSRGSASLPQSYQSSADRVDSNSNNGHYNFDRIVSLGQKNHNNDDNAMDCTHYFSSRENESQEQRKRGKNVDRLGQFAPLIDLQVPRSVCRLIFDLLKCNSYGNFIPDEALSSFNVLKDELNNMISQPDIFLDDVEISPSDVSRLRFPYKMYGRSKELNELLQAAKTSRDEFETKNHLIVVSGYSGSGKTQLVKESREALCKNDWIFLSTSFERGQAYQPLVLLFSSLEDFFASLLVRRQLKKGVKSLNKSVHYCRHIIESIQRSIPLSELAVLSNLIPSLALLVPSISSLPAKSNSENDSFFEHHSNRLSILLRLLIRTISSAEHPIVLFFDDFQWADMDFIRDFVLDSSHLSKSDIGDGPKRHILVVGCYRTDQEGAGEERGIQQYISTLEKPYVTVTNIKILDLTEASMNKMISETLFLPQRLTKALSSVVYAKTSGNPLFIKSFLDSIVEEGKLYYSIEGKRWMWDVFSIETIFVGDNVAKLLARKLLCLPLEVQEALKVVSCFGTKIPKFVVKNSETADALRCAIAEGLLNQDNIFYRFVHDAVHSAAYDLIPSTDRATFHFKLGHDIIQMSPDGSISDANILLAIDQINRSRPLEVTDPSLCIKFAEMNLQAGRHCMESAGFVSALNCFEFGKSFLNESHWESDYSLVLQLTDAACLACFISTSFDKASTFVNEVLVHAKCLEDKLNAYSVHIKSSISIGLEHDVMDLVLIVLRELGQNFDTNPSNSSLSALAKNELISTRQLLEKTGNTRLLELHRMTDPKVLSAMNLMGDVAKAMYRSQPSLMALLACRMITLSIYHGTCASTCIGIILYAVAQMQDMDADKIEHCYHWGKFAMTLFRTFGDGNESMSHKMKQYLLFYVSIWVEPFQSTAASLLANYKDCQNSGDNDTTALILASHSLISMISGRDLGVLYKENTDIGQKLVSGLFCPIFVSIFCARTHTLFSFDSLI